jgi:hypothetical protein
MTLFDDILTQFPPDVQETVRKVWEALGPNEKAGFLSLLVGFPADINLVKLLVKLSTAQIRQAFGSKHRVVNEIQGKFVDEPRSAVQQADALVAEVINKITRMFANEHSSLEAQWQEGKMFLLKISARLCSITAPSSIAW